MTDFVLIAHLAATWFMVGLSTTIQWVHYPLFPRHGSQWGSFHASHTRRMLLVLLVPWSIEGVTALALPFLLTGTDRWLAAGGLVLVGSIAAITVLGAVPMHRKLASGWDAAIHAQLMGVDRTRWVLWLLRGIVAVALLV